MDLIGSCGRFGLLEEFLVSRNRLGSSSTLALFQISEMEGFY